MYVFYMLFEFFILILNLDDLFWDEEDSLFDWDLFDENFSVFDVGVDIGSEEEKILFLL